MCLLWDNSILTAQSEQRVIRLALQYTTQIECCTNLLLLVNYETHLHEAYDVNKINNCTYQHANVSADGKGLVLSGHASGLRIDLKWLVLVSETTSQGAYYFQ
jgi:hypothetical protein